MSMTGGDPVQKKPAQADTIYFGGPILSMDASDPGPEAVAVAGDRILATGSLDAMRALAHAGTRQVDLAGRTLLPGFIDAHSHFVDAALLTASVDLNSYPLGSVHCIEDMVALLRQRAEITPPGQCIQGWGYDDSLLAEKRHPTRQDLDRASTRHPIVLQHISGWVTTGNSLALEQVGLAGAEACAGDNVVLYRDGSGVPTGVIEAATSPLLRLAPPPDEAGFMQAMRAGSETYLASGCTTAQDGWLVGGERLRLLHDALRQDALGLRLVIYLVGQECSMEEFCATYPQVPSGEALDERRMLIMGAAKLACDGSIQAYTGYLSRPYHVLPPDKPADYRGYPSCDIEAMTRRIAELHAAGRQIAVHGNGDAAIEAILDAFEAAQAAHPRADARHIVIHSQMARAEQMERMARLAVIPSFFITHTYYWGDRHYERFMGPERACRMSPAGDALRLGLPFTLHSDTYVTPMDPLMLVWSAVNRRSFGGRDLGREAQGVPVLEALKGVTINAAYQGFEERHKGSITPGKLADFVVLEENPLTVEPLHIKDIVVAATIVGNTLRYGSL